MTYPEQLQTTQWENKRNEILVRDNFACQKCNNSKILSKTKKGKLSSGRFYVEKECEYNNVFVDPQFIPLNGKQTIFYGMLKKSTIYIIGARFKTPIEIELENYSKNLWQKITDNSAILSDPEFSIKMRVDMDELNKKLNSEGFDNFVWIKFTGLHIHHKYYIKKQKAWEYKNEALVTLCEICHDELHKKQEIPVYNDKMELLEFYKFCTKCYGKGVFPEYSHVQSGICFRCNGNRYEELIINVNPR